MANSDEVYARASALLDRTAADRIEQAQRARRRRAGATLRILGRLGAAEAAVLAAMFAWAMVVGPIGLFGALAVVAAMIAAAVLVLIASIGPAETPQRLATSDLAQLPARTESWLQRQRPALPAPAQRLADGIGLKLDALGPQLAALDPREPAAAELRKLLATELPELVEGYGRVPQALRKVERDGPAPDAQLIDGLKVVDAEIARMSANLASGDLTKLATQGRYLELKYKDDR